MNVFLVHGLMNKCVLVLMWLLLQVTNWFIENCMLLHIRNLIRKSLSTPGYAGLWQPIHENFVADDSVGS